MDVTLPKWGTTMQEAVLVAWLSEVGDRVDEGQPIATIETDKVETDIEAPVTGTVTSILIALDESVEVGKSIAVIQEHS